MEKLRCLSALRVSLEWVSPSQWLYTVHSKCRITFRNRISRNQSSEKKPAIIEEEAMKESFDKLVCEM